VRTLVILLGAATLLTACNPLRDVAQSHIDGNVPSQDSFLPFLRRDLTAYFDSVGLSSDSIDFSPLRGGVSQTGIGFPKFYVWVRLLAGDSTLQEGAATVAAVQKQRFFVADYVLEHLIRSDPVSLDTIFPLLVADSIRLMLRIQQ
jgi:hypothetical protein